MLTRSVYAGKRLLMEQAHKSVAAGNLLHGLHYQLVVIDCNVTCLIYGRQLVLCRSHLVMLCLCRYPQLPQLVVQILHVCSDTLSYSTEVVIVHLLALGCWCTEERASGEYQVFPLKILLTVDDEILLLDTNGWYDLLCRIVSEKP